MAGPMSERWPNVACVNIGTLAATTTLPAGYFRKRTRLKEVRLADQAGLAADDTNYYTVSLQDGSGNVFASFSTKLTGGNGSLTANTFAKCVLGGSGTTVLGDSTNPEVDIPAGTNLVLVVTKHGTGVPTLGQLQMETYPL